ncbi:MAG: thioredoxin domain-containing protein [Acidimicrobiia bacterium]|nr:thioredoxin domain-containing protein [Acidimicrobiia bacterium]
MPNRLANSTSPYLLQHQDNPVDWYEWDEEAFAVARTTDRPVLLSVGYSACHWCHVMAHESFEDEATAGYMNQHFVNVKVDREERPDIDRIYMDALQAMTGHGGWPMTVFMTPDGDPFHAGTYYPKTPRGHMPSFQQILESVVTAWTEKRDQLNDQAGRLTAAVRAGIPAGEEVPPTTTAVAAAVESLTANYDQEMGGFGTAPKFPQAPVLEFLLRTMVLEPSRRSTIEPTIRSTLDAMRAGGIYDQIGGGFARYSVDRRWLIPHFEKMLYDNALLARVYLRAGQVMDEPAYTATARETLDYLAREMRDPEGGIHAAEDADSEGVEGKYYVWSYDEFVAVAGEDADLVGELYGVTREGNFEGTNNLNLALPIATVAANYAVSSQEVLAAKHRVDAALLRAREERIRPGRDDKVIAAWNGLALQAFSEAAAVLADDSYLDVANGIAEFVLTEMVTETGRLMRSWRDGRTSGPGFCVDYAAMSVGLLTLYQVSGEERWFWAARQLTLSMAELFAGEHGLYSTGADQPALIARPRDFMDNPLPSANSLAAEAFTLLGALSGDEPPLVDGIRRGAARLLERAPHAVPHLLSVLHMRDTGMREVAIVGSGSQRRAMEEAVWKSWRPDTVVALGRGDDTVPLLQGRDEHDGEATAYVCRNFVCDLPVTTVDGLTQRLDA